MPEVRHGHRVVLASGNAGKQREFAALLRELPIELILQSELGIAGAEETGATFEANALLKARHSAAASGLPALADDSGLEVDALGGRPGVWSARYAGPGASDDDNNRKLLAELERVPESARSARYRCVLAFVHSADDPEPLLAHGVWEGSIAVTPAGAGGFGFDPLFVPASMSVRVAQLDPALKNRLSHRAQAASRLLQLWRARPQ
jgi:XTP/dITP diphosphohydrolase